MQPLESFDELILPPGVDCRLQELAKRKSQGKLTEKERQELDLLVTTKQTLDQLRAKAKTLLNANRPASIRLPVSIRNGLPVVEVPTGTPAFDPEVVRRFLREQVF